MEVGADGFKLDVSGIMPAYMGDDWFLLDDSGKFRLDKSITATIWVVGGGCDGTAGEWNGNKVDSNNDPMPDTGTGVSYSGSGGDGGEIYIYRNVELSADTDYNITIAEANNPKSIFWGITGNWEYKKCEGGLGGSLPLPPAGEQYAGQENAIPPTAGTNGVETPYGYVGSSGGGGAVCDGTTNADNGAKGGVGAGSGTNHRGAGTDALYYGCGGGGGAVCGRVAEGFAGGKGMQGCVVIQYEITDDGSSGSGGSGGTGGSTGGDSGSGDSGGSSGGDSGSGDSGGSGSSGGSGGSGSGDSGDSSGGSGSGGSSGGSDSGGSGTTTEPQKTLIVQKHYKRVCNTKNTYNTDYYSNNSKHSCCGNTGCGCGNANALSYTDTVQINMGSEELKKRIATLTSELDTVNAERTALQNKIIELQAKLDSISGT